MAANRIYRTHGGHKEHGDETQLRHGAPLKTELKEVLGNEEQPSWEWAQH